MSHPIHDAHQSIDAFLAALAAKQPTPGGGAVAALAGTLSAAMGEMVLNYSLGRKDSAPHDAKIRTILDEFTRARQMLLQLMTEDQAAYQALTRIRKEGGPSDPRYAAALLACIRVPQAVATTAVAILDLCDRIADVINPWLASDMAICAELAMATTRCAVSNVRVNLADVPNEQDRRRFEQFTAQTLSKATPLIQRVLVRIWARRGTIK